MIKVKNVSEALVGDFISYNQKLSVVSSISRDHDFFVVQMEDGTEIEFLATTRVEIFRIVDRDNQSSF
jgi:hypothetical protein